MATLSIRHVPKDVYDILKEEAEAEHRSLNQQVIWLLKEGLKTCHRDAKAAWNRIGQRRSQLRQTRKQFSDSTILLREDRKR